MINFRDVIIEILIGISFMISGILIGMSDYPYLIFLPFIITIYLKAQIKKRKKILPFVKDDFRALGYELTAERASRRREIKSEITFEPTIGATHYSRFKYFRKFYRIFQAKNMEGKIVLLNTIITRKWNGKNQIEIVKIKNVC